MRWRFVDRVTAFEPWTRIEGRKCVSLEEYSLLDAFGREGEFPESLVIESCVQFARWLVAASSGFRQFSTLVSVGGFLFENTVRPGHALDVAVTITARSDDLIETRCEVSVPSGTVGKGVLCLRIVPLHDFNDPDNMRVMWKELRGQASQ